MKTFLASLLVAGLAAISAAAPALAQKGAQQGGSQSHYGAQELNLASQARHPDARQEQADDGSSQQKADPNSRASKDQLGGSQAPSKAAKQAADHDEAQTIETAGEEAGKSDGGHLEDRRGKPELTGLERAEQARSVGGKPVLTGKDRARKMLEEKAPQNEGIQKAFEAFERGKGQNNGIKARKKGR